MHYIVVAALVISISNLFKLYRLNLVIDKELGSYGFRKQGYGLLIANILNIVAPLRLGHLLRIIYSGRKTKNGISFSFSAILIEILADILCTAVIFVIFILLGTEVNKSLSFYTIVLALTLSLILISKKYLKKIVYRIAKLFNDKIELKVLKTAWYFSFLLDNIIKTSSGLKFAFLSLVIWILNIISCLLIGMSTNVSMSDVFSFFFSESNIITGGYRYVFNLEIITFYIISSVLLYLIVRNIKVKRKSPEYNNLLPHQEWSDKLNLLRRFYEDKEGKIYFKNYLKTNTDVIIIKDFSAGSNATTLLCSRNSKLIFRKYVFGKDANKLEGQVDWIERNKERLNLPNIQGVSKTDGIYSYDMEYIPGAITFFSYIHSSADGESWKNIKNVLEDLEKKLYSKTKTSTDQASTCSYIDEKVLGNISKIMSDKRIKNILNYRFLYINGEKYYNLPFFQKILAKENLLRIFKNDPISEIHGDLTIENIVFSKNKIRNRNYYLIDPNIGNIHESPYLDYAKLLQSLHGKYELFMKVKEIKVSDNYLEFILLDTVHYTKLREELFNYLEDKFGLDGLKSILYHEIVHWLRLMPYKLNKDDDRGLIFYSGMIMVLNDIYRRYK